MLRKLLLFLLIFIGINGFSQQRILSENAFVSVLTADTGNELYSLFGHTAIRVSDPINGIDVVFNYGTFDFRTPNFYLKFVKGDLQYFVSTSTYEGFVEEYIYENRGVYEQKLNLTQAQKQEIFNHLVAVLSSEEKYYTYKFIDRNCTTMVVEQVESTIKNKISLKVKDAGNANRRILYGYLHEHFYENLGINIMFGCKTDKDLYNLYLPLQFLESIKITKNSVTGQPLTTETATVNPKNNGATPFSFRNSFYSYLLVIIIIALANKRVVYLTWLVICALLGIFLFWAGFYSLHEELSCNYNVMLFNPLLLVLVVFVLARNRKWALITAYTCAAILLAYLLFLLNKVQLLMFLPFIGLNALILWRILKKVKNSH
ncbi:lipoprotein N-acyltransferase Lnb domain-containing protein [Flavobacterium sp. 3HN19-14]|uniref:lipoprotein N-acyltransferase Lnb domain-containing protein n=1 Tax=Flavobacterium sp. 3HN19-14 TaxID=3448133 RepID=UPI003EDFCC25